MWHRHHFVVAHMAGSIHYHNTCWKAFQEAHCRILRSCRLRASCQKSHAEALTLPVSTKGTQVRPGQSGSCATSGLCPELKAMYRPPSGAPKVSPASHSHCPLEAKLRGHRTAIGVVTGLPSSAQCLCQHVRGMMMHPNRVVAELCKAHLQSGSHRSSLVPPHQAHGRRCCLPGHRRLCAAPLSCACQQTGLRWKAAATCCSI